MEDIEWNRNLIIYIMLCSLDQILFERKQIDALYMYIRWTNYRTQLICYPILLSSLK